MVLRLMRGLRRPIPERASWIHVEMPQDRSSRRRARRRRGAARSHPLATLVLVLLLPGLLAVPIARAIGAEDAGAVPDAPAGSPASGDQATPPSEDSGAAPESSGDDDEAESGAGSAAANSSGQSYGKASGDGGGGLSLSSRPAPSPAGGPPGPAPDQFAKKNGADPAAPPSQASGNRYGPESGDGGPKPVAPGNASAPDGLAAGSSQPVGDDGEVRLTKAGRRAYQKIRDWNSRPLQERKVWNLEVPVPSEEVAKAVLEAVLETEFRGYTQVPQVQGGQRRYYTYHWDVQRSKKTGVLIGHSPTADHSKTLHVQIESPNGTVRILFSKDNDKFTLLDSQLELQLTQPAAPPPEATGPRF